MKECNNEHIITLDIDPNMIQFPIQIDRFGKPIVIKVSREFMKVSPVYTDDETIHCIGYDSKNKIMMVVNHKLNDDIHKKPYELIPYVKYFYDVSESTVMEFMKAKNKTKWFKDRICGVYVNCVEPLSIYFW
ncbi:MAG: hypothetical protein J6D03_00875 [Clostridia bacterium]|nr:hypothetical protein [Clostridia bacterium]